MTYDPHLSASLIGQEEVVMRDALGPVVEVLTRTDRVPDGAPGLLRGTMRPGAFVPLHSHPDVETFHMLEGTLEGLVFDDSGQHHWVPIGPGQTFHVPPDARHALRNPTDQLAVSLVVSTVDLNRFFEENGAPVTSPFDVPVAAPESMAAFAAAAQRYGQWLATPEENAAVGLLLPTA